MSSDHTTAELAERLKAIRETIRQSLLTQPQAPQIEPLQPVALDKVRQASALTAYHADRLGKLNPRPAGIANNAIQSAKGTMARSMDWMLRPQREFNQATSEAIHELTAAVENLQTAARVKLTALESTYQQELQQLRSQLRELSEAVSHQLIRTQTETRENVRDLRWTYEGALSRHIASVEETRLKLSEDIRELNRRLAAQSKISAPRPAISSGPDSDRETSGLQPRVSSPVLRAQAELEVDYFALEKDFRGTEVEIRSRQNFYLPYFSGCRNVLDIACGRGEFLEVMKQAGVTATGVDLDADMVGRCLEKGMSAIHADVFQYLREVGDASLDGIFCSQFVEHLIPADYTRLVMEAARKLAPGGIMAIETQNPECLAIFAKSFYIDPTHMKPIPAAQMRFLFEQAGLEEVCVHYLSPARQQFPLLEILENPVIEATAVMKFNQSIENFNAAFFGGMDYAVIGKRPGGK